MKKLLLFLGLAFLTMSLKAQKANPFHQNSSVNLKGLNKTQINNLALLGKVWGFLKYYHPEVGKGNYNWDSELFKILPEYKNITDHASRDNLLISWIDNLGEVKLCKKCKEVSEDAFLKPDFDWVKSDITSNVLKEKLVFIQKNRHQGKHYYVEASLSDEAKFKNEDSYSHMTYPNDGYRLLSLFRYWNIIQYFFPYKYLTDKDWNICLLEYIPKFLDAKNELEYELAAIQIIGDIKDTHANLWGGTNNKMHKTRGWNSPPFRLGFIENKLVIVDYFDDEKWPKTNLKLGDIITHINNKTVDELIQKELLIHPASNQSTQLRDICFDILRSNKDSISITVLRNKKTFETTIRLYSPKTIKGFYRSYKLEKNKPSSKKLENNIGYITLKNITPKDFKTIREELKNTKGIVVDIRGRPAISTIRNLAGFFTSKKSWFVKHTETNTNYPGEFTFGSSRFIQPKDEFYKGKVILLVNQFTQSHGEYTAMALQAGDNVTTIGSTTAGADGNTSKFYLPGGLMTMISGIGVYYTDGTETQRVGIIPDIEVLPTIKGIKEGRDEILEKAIEIINKI